MGRVVQGYKKDIVFTVRLSRSIALWVETKRGNLSRSEFIRALIVREMGKNP